MQLFPTDKPKNRLLNAQERETDLWLAKIFKRPCTYYTQDVPYYPWLPPTPKVPKVNFDLNYTE